jgi:thioredoxin-related protein
MKFTKTVGIAILLLSFSSLTLSAEENKPDNGNQPTEETKKEIVWHAYDAGLKKAKEEDKHVFIDFTAKLCGYCKKMDRETFSDQRVIDILNNDFVSVKVDGESKRELDIDGYKITERNLAVQEFGVRGYPTFWFLKSDGTKLAPIGGYRPTDYMIEALTYIKEQKYDDSTATDGEGQ